MTPTPLLWCAHGRNGLILVVANLLLLWKFCVEASWKMCFFKLKFSTKHSEKPRSSIQTLVFPDDLLSVQLLFQYLSVFTILFFFFCHLVSGYILFSKTSSSSTASSSLHPPWFYRWYVCCTTYTHLMLNLLLLLSSIHPWTSIPLSALPVPRITPHWTYIFCSQKFLLVSQQETCSLVLANPFLVLSPPPQRKVTSSQLLVPFSSPCESCFRAVLFFHYFHNPKFFSLCSGSFFSPSQQIKLSLPSSLFLLAMQQHLATLVPLHGPWRSLQLQALPLWSCIFLPQL